jgi:putative transposase
MSTYTQILYHLVFSTKNRAKTLDSNRLPELYKIIWGLLKNKNCHLFRIGGTSDHIHILLHIPPIIAPSTLIKDIKLASSQNIKMNNLFPAFEAWQAGYGAFTCSIREKPKLIDYIKKQEEHHKTKTSKEELIELLIEHGIKFDLKYLL